MTMSRWIVVVVMLLVMGCVDRGNGIQCVLDPLTLEQRREQRINRGEPSPIDKVWMEAEAHRSASKEVDGELSLDGDAREQALSGVTDVLAPLTPADREMVLRIALFEALEAKGDAISQEMGISPVRCTGSRVECVQLKIDRLQELKLRQQSY